MIYKVGDVVRFSDKLLQHYRDTPEDSWMEGMDELVKRNKFIISIAREIGLKTTDYELRDIEGTWMERNLQPYVEPLPEELFRI